MNFIPLLLGKWVSFAMLSLLEYFISLISYIALYCWISAVMSADIA